MGMNVKGWNLLNQINEELNLSSFEITEEDEYHEWRQTFWSLVEQGCGFIKDKHIKAIEMIDKVLGYD